MLIFKKKKRVRVDSNLDSRGPPSYRSVRTTPYVPGFNVKMGNIAKKSDNSMKLKFWLCFPDVAKREAYCSGNGFETFDQTLIKHHKWQQNYPILNEDFLVHMGSGCVAKPNLDNPTQNVSVIDETLKPSPWLMNNKKISSATLYI